MKSMRVRTAAWLPFLWVSCAWVSLPLSAQVTISTAPVPGYAALEARSRLVLVPPQAASESGQLLINGNPVDPKYFPAVLRMTSGGTCTAAIVGPATVLIAAHCVSSFGGITLVFSSDQSVDGVCERAPGYDPTSNPSEDWALCLLEHEVSGFPYETVDTASIPPVGTRVVLSGHGCTEQGEPAGSVLRLGVSTVAARPSSLPAETSTLYTKSNLDANEAVLCPGDSGGPAWVFTADLASPRSIVGVNSRTTFQNGYSLLAATASSAGKTFLDDWTAAHVQEICGVNRTASCM